MIFTIVLAVILVITLLQGWYAELTGFAVEKEISKKEPAHLPLGYYTNTPGVDLFDLTQDQKKN